ncbi:MAG: NADH-quinone oxidoreductase subunit NuoG [Gammaproteobacteria bacterium]|nr:NADH-quinone oxidoreductase subunit NuoG [Gammaproteobacteria bacterium]
MPTIEIDGRVLDVENGTMIIKAADDAGIYIPRFCYHEKLSVAANCRMCLVEVEKAPKPLPACATPVTDGMKVFTRSKLAVNAQKSTMEFLLINHPLDCPVCDQGGECPLQDQAMGYGGDVSRFAERKRVVEDKDIGPLIATEMTRCIHCTRCIRFGREIGGLMEMGATGRGEHMEIGTMIGRSINSELSGNMIDLCPVGALTDKTYRFSARVWELVSHKAVSPHDTVGSNLHVQTLRGLVKRVLPRDNESINECWIPDRDRYSYESLASEDRLLEPKIRVSGQWQEVDWETALDYAAQGLRRVIHRHGAERIGALASPTATLEEFYLLQRLLRSLGSHNVDHRLRQHDFTDDSEAPAYPSLGLSIADLDTVSAALLVGSNIRKDQPILGLRLRKASTRGARIMAVNPLDYPFHFELAEKQIVAPHRMVNVLADVVAAAGQVTGRSVAPSLGDFGDPNRGPAMAMAEALCAAGERGLVILGQASMSHPQRANLLTLCHEIANLAGIKLGVLGEANSAAAWIAGCVPHRGPEGVDAGPGLNATEMIQHPLNAYLLLGLEPAVDHLAGAVAEQVVGAADFVVSLSVFDTSDTGNADVLLPMAAFTETSGTYVNCEGRLQSVAAAAPAPGMARPAWKILRVLGNQMNQPGFEYVSSEQVRDELDLQNVGTGARGIYRFNPATWAGERDEIDLERIPGVPLYRVDSYTRRAPALQATVDNPPAAAHLHPTQAARLELAREDRIRIHAGDTAHELPVVFDERVPEKCVYLPGGYTETDFAGSAAWVRVVKE